jgi:hypothetical protein
MDHIRKHAPRYYPGFESEQIRIQLLEKQERPSAMLYRFKVSNGAQIRSVFVKVSLRNLTKNQTKGSVFEKPLLFPKTEPIDMPRLHYSALRIIDKYITGLDNGQFGAIRVLDYLPQYKAVFTEESSDPCLRQLFLRENRLHSLFTHDELTSAFQNAGTWLRMYQAMPKEEDVKVRHQHREDYDEAITKLTDFLAKIVGDELFFNRTASIIINKGREVLPESLPLGLGHGDYAMRNILIGPNARVTVLDTFAKWRTPIYEDVGYFLNGLKMSTPQIVSQGLAFSSGQLSAYEQAFLKGYFEQKSIPYPAIRLFEILALLDKWSSFIANNYHQKIKFKTFGGVMAALTNRYFKRRVKSLLREIAES